MIAESHTGQNISNQVIAESHTRQNFSNQVIAESHTGQKIYSQGIDQKHNDCQNENDALNRLNTYPAEVEVISALQQWKKNRWR